MKKFLSMMMALLVVIGISGCGSSENTDPKTIDTLNVMFVPSKNPDDIQKASEPMANLIKESLTNQGFSVNTVNVTTGDSYEVVGEALASGSVDVGFIPAGTYVKYENEGVKPLMAATRNGLSINSKDAKVWNENKPTQETEEPVNFYNSLIIAGPSEKGKALGEKVNNGEKPTWEELNEATWCTSGPTSSSGYLYPSLWLKENYDKTITDLENTTRTKGYSDAMNSLQTQVCDISVGFADMRIDEAENWEGDIWADTNVIGVSGPIMNDTISVSTTSKNMSDELQKALITTFSEMPNSETGKEVMKIYNHTGYVEVKPEDFDAERKVQELSE